MSVPQSRCPHRDARPGRARSPGPRPLGLHRAPSRRATPLFTATVAVFALLISSLLPLTSCASFPHWSIVALPNQGWYASRLNGVTAVPSSTSTG